MENNEREIICYRLLSEVLIDNGYASLVLNDCLKGIKDEKDRAYISNLFYGVLDKSVQFDYIIKSLTERMPKTSVGTIIKVGLYRMRYMSTPIYAAINETVDLAKKVGKGGVSAFVNAVLRSSETFAIPNRGEIDDVKFLSIRYSVPEWICAKLVKQCGFDFTQDFFRYEPNKLTHIRHNSRVISKSEFEKKIEKSLYSKTEYGYYVTHNVLNLLNKSEFTVQSLSSMIAVNCYLPNCFDAPTVIDLCGAPGGKSIYLYELRPNAKITCCDLYPHRVELIKKYAARMRSNIKPMLCDATEIMPEWYDVADMVICDVPCSGIGVYKNKPDVLFNKKYSDIEEIKKTQMSILECAKNYVKVGGFLCYSTCTVFQEENEDNVFEFLKNNPNYRLDKIQSPYSSDNGMVKLFPHINDGADGFFVARLRRIE